MISPSQVAVTPRRRLRIAMGTWVAIEATADYPPVVAAAIDAAFDAIADIERWMHPQLETSDLAKLNRCDIGWPVVVRAWTWELLALAQRVNQLSDGVFDPCLPSRPGRMPDIELTFDRTVVCWAPVALDFGGIAKGYAVDRAVDVLIAHGCRSGLVNAGGDLKVFGPYPEAILLRRPGGTLGPLDVCNAALAVSDVDSCQQPAEHRGYYVRGKREPLQCRYAAVLAPQAATADALVKCVLLCAESDAQRVLREFDASCIDKRGAGDCSQE